MWFVGGGMKGGYVYGVMDELGIYVIENCMYVYDLYVMIFYFMGIDYE